LDSLKLQEYRALSPNPLTTRIERERERERERDTDRQTDIERNIAQDYFGIVLSQIELDRIYVVDNYRPSYCLGIKPQ